MTRLDRGFALTWLGHATFKLVTRAGRVVLIDPWIEGNPACPEDARAFDRIDVMAITHGHGDHMGDAVPLAKKFNPAIVCNFEIAHFLERKGVSGAKGMNKGGTQQVADIGFTMTHAIHSSGIVDGGQMLYGGEPAGYVLTLEDGTRIFHAGDTAVHAEMAFIGELYAPDVAILPIGDHFTMSPREAALAVRMLRPKWIVPCHWGTFPLLTGTPDALREELRRLGLAGEVVALKPGETLD